MNKVKIDNSSSLYRDITTMAIINNDSNEYNAYLNQRNRFRQTLAERNMLEQKVNNLENSVEEIKSMLKQLVKGQ